MNPDKPTSTLSGYLMLGIGILLLLAGVANIILSKATIFLTPILILLAFFIFVGLFIILPNTSRVLTLFGKYVGTVSTPGFHWMNPFIMKKSISMKANNMETSQLKVNDKQGNPILIAAVVVWKVNNAYKATFDVEHYQKFVEIQSESALRKMAMQYSYDNLEDEHAEITLRSNSLEINEMLETEISERLSMAGIEVIEARITHLAYAQEIANAMLQRQQATAVIAARSKIVEGAVGMVEMALDSLSKKEIVHLDNERKAAMVSNLLVVLCSDRSVNPVINTGTLYQ
ncbi:MAG: SPFH domain-containing protein [Saprospiraceae bacterium]